MSTAGPDSPQGGAHRLDEPQPGVPSSDASLSDLFGRLTGDVTTLLQEELALAKAEIKQEATRAGKASGMLVAGGVAGFVALLLISWSIAWLLALAVPTWAAFLIVGALYAIVAGALVSSGRKKLQQVNPKPEQTMQTLKEDKEWLKNQA